jgi:hypothetical protein
MVTVSMLPPAVNETSPQKILGVKLLLCKPTFCTCCCCAACRTAGAAAVAMLTTHVAPSPERCLRAMLL